MTTLITGAAGGIGREMASQLTAGGEAVIGTARGVPPDDMPQVEWHPADVTDPVSLRALAQAVGDRPLDLLVCNAGVYLDRGRGLDDGIDADLWATSFAVNATGVYLTIEALMPALRRAAGARIAIISSQNGTVAKAGGGAYAYRSSKAAALNIGKNLALDLAPEGISVGIYHPGWVRTKMGGPSAAITPEVAAAGLLARFAALSPATTGVFETYDGKPHPL